MTLAFRFIIWRASFASFNRHLSERKLRICISQFDLLESTDREEIPSPPKVESKDHFPYLLCGRIGKFPSHHYATNWEPRKGTIKKRLQRINNNCCFDPRSVFELNRCKITSIKLQRNEIIFFICVRRFFLSLLKRGPLAKSISYIFINKILT